LRTAFFAQLFAIVLLAAVLVPHWVESPLSEYVLAPYQQKLMQFQVGGVMEGLSRRLNHRGPVDQGRLIEQSNRLLPYRVGLVPLESLNLSDAKLVELNKNKIIYREHSRQFFRLLANKSQVLVVNDPLQVSPHVQSHAKLESMGTLYLLQNVLAETPQGQWAIVTDRLGKSFDYPLNLHRIDSLPLNQSRRNALNQGETVTVISSARLKYGSGVDYVYQRVSDSELALVIGPIAPAIESRIFEYKLFNVVLMGGAIALLLTLWLFPTWLSSRHLTRAVEQYARGQFDFRMPVITASSFNPLSRVFNIMAEELQRLFNANTVLTLALSGQLKTPLSNINRGIRQLEPHATPESPALHIDAVHEAIEDLNQLTSDVLLMARYQKVPPAVNLEPVCWHTWIRNVVDSANSPHTTLTINRDNAEGDYIDIDIELMSRAVKGLIDFIGERAYEHSTVSVSCTGSLLSLNLCHDGKSLDADQRAWLLAFLKSSHEPNGMIDSLNLFAYAIANCIVQVHQGRLSFSHDAGQWETLTLLLPFPAERRLHVGLEPVL